MSGVRWVFHEQRGRRESHRFSAIVPVLIRLGDENFTSRLANIGRGGAMLETAAPILAGAKITMCCGTVVAEAAVMWRKPGRIGVNFHMPLTDREIQEQISRSASASRHALTFG